MRSGKHYKPGTAPEGTDPVLVDPKNPRQPNKMSNDLVVYHFRSLAGRVLTLIDSSLPPGPQNIALKGLVKKEFREQLSRAWEYAYGSASCAESCDSGLKNILD